MASSLGQSVAAAAWRRKNLVLIPRTEQGARLRAHVSLPVVQLLLNQVGIINLQRLLKPFCHFQYLIASGWYSFFSPAEINAVHYWFFGISSKKTHWTQPFFWQYPPRYHIPVHRMSLWVLWTCWKLMHFLRVFSSFFPVFNGSKFLAGIRNLTVFGPPYAWASVTMIICGKYKLVTWSQ